MKKLSSLVLVLSIICITVSVSHAEQYWAKTYVYPGLESHANYITQTSDGGYIVLGFYLLTHGYDLILKLDSGGDISWGKSGPFINSIKQTLDTGYIAAGYYFWLDGSNLVVEKLDENGNVSWRKVMGVMEYGEYSYARSVQQTSDSGYIVAGYTNSFGAGDYDIWVLKLNSNGDVSWQKSYGGSERDYAYSIQETTDGGYIMSGNTNSCGAGDYDMWVLKLNSNGDISWQKSYGGSGYDSNYSIQQTMDGGYIVAGNTNSFGAGDYDIWVLKLNSNGDISWQKSYGGSGDDRTYSMQQTTDGGYIMSGNTNSFGAGGYDAWTLKLNSTGNIVWEKTLGDSGNDYGYSIHQTTDGGYILAGSTPDDNQDFEVEALWLMKIGSNVEIPNCGNITISTSHASLTNTAASAANTIVTDQLTFAPVSHESGMLQDISPVERNTVCCYDSDDYDVDGIGDVCDNCPEDYNPSQEDADDDGIGGVCDPCPNDPKNDIDNDGICGDIDNCPYIYNPNQDDTYPPLGNGIGDACECEGDFNCDGNVDAADVTTFLDDFGRNQYNDPCADGNQCNGDSNCDGNVDSADVTVFLEDFGRNQYNNPCPSCEVGDWCVY